MKIKEKITKIGMNKKSTLVFTIIGICLITLTIVSAWQSDSEIVGGLGDIGSYSTPFVFEKDSTWYLVSGESAGNISGFNWTGSTWQSDSTFVNGLPGIGAQWDATLTIFEKDLTWYLILGKQDGNFYGYNWTGSTWQSDSTFVNGLPDIGWDADPFVFEKDATWYLISGEETGIFNGFNWTGSAWQVDSAIIDGLGDIGGASTATVFEKDSTWYLISGRNAEQDFVGFNWTGSTWQSDSEIVDGINNIGSYRSSPMVFEKDSIWYLITGESDGIFTGYKISDDLINPNITINYPLNTTYNISSINFNITAIDDIAISSCWMTLDLGVTNYTMLNTTSNDIYNYTNSSIPDGSYTSNFYCNDTSNNINNTENISFSIDATYPLIQISYPSNDTTHSNYYLDVNYTYSDLNVDSCWWTEDSGVINNSIVCGINLTEEFWKSGTNNVKICINDSANNVNCSSISFNIYESDYYSNYSDVLLVCNEDSSVSQEICSYFINQRIGMGFNINHIVNLTDISVNETINETEYQKIVTQINDTLESIGVNNINYIVTTKGVPLRTGLGKNCLHTDDDYDNGLCKSVDSKLVQAFDTQKYPFFYRKNTFSHELYGNYLVTRLTGITVEDAKRLIDNSDNAELSGDILLNGYSSGYGDLLDCQGAYDRLISKGISADLNNAEFLKNQDNLSGYWSWGSNACGGADSCSNSTDWNLSFNPGAIGETGVSTSGRTFTHEWDNTGPYGAQSLIGDLITMNITGIKGYVYEPLSSAVALPEIVFDRYTRGYNLADSYYMASSEKDWMDVIVGDPKTSIVKNSTNLNSTSTDYCMDLFSANTTYTLERSINTATPFLTAGNCFNILANNITLEMNGFNITGDLGSFSENDRGINMEGYNQITIQNGGIINFTTGIYLNSNNSILRNLTVDLTYLFGITGSTSNSVLEDLTISGSSHGFKGFFGGLYIEGGSNNTLTNINSSNNIGQGIQLASSNDILTNITTNLNQATGLVLGGDNGGSKLINIVSNSNTESGSHGVGVGSPNNNITNVICNSNAGAGISITWDGDNNTFKNLTLTYNERNGIKMQFNANYNSFIDVDTSHTPCVGGGLGCSGISLSNDCYYNNFTNVISNFNTQHGIDFGSSNGNIFINSTVNSNGYSGVAFRGASSGNQIINLTSNSNSRYGIIVDYSSNNTFTNINLWNCSSSSSYSCIYAYTSNNNKFENFYINYSTNSGKGIFIKTDSIYTNSSNNQFKNILMENIVGDNVKIEDTTTKFALNNTFLNVTYNDALETITGNDAELIRKWYYKAYVNDTAGNNVSNANITAYNSSSSYNFNLTTDASGWTETDEIIDYINLGGTTTYSFLYTIFAVNSSYNQINHTRNITLLTNIYDDVFTLNNVAPVVVKYTPISGLSTTATQILYTYFVSDTSAITSCSLIINGTTQKTDTTINTSINNTFDFAYSPRGNFNWSIECSNLWGLVGTTGNIELDLRSPAGYVPGGSTGGDTDDGTNATVLGNDTILTPPINLTTNETIIEEPETWSGNTREQMEKALTFIKYWLFEKGWFVYIGFFLALVLILRLAFGGKKRERKVNRGFPQPRFRR